MDYRGSRWYKCDFHLHTPASECFEDKSITPEQWVQACCGAGLQCVAVTDHNTGAWVDCIKQAAEGKALIVFPGVEITCDTSKIHLLILFEVDKTTEYINDFLIECGITRSDFATSEAHSTKTISEIANIANDKGGLIIPAHIDEYNGLAYCASKISQEEFLAKTFIHAVQIVHPEFVNSALVVKDNAELLARINSYYGQDKPAIGEDDIKAAYNGVQSAIRMNKRLLTFSDNPESECSSKHGIAGIGRQYTWIKMDENPTIEGLRQAFMTPDRAKNCIDSPLSPYKNPKLWIRKICVTGTTLVGANESFVVEFNPQLTTIIGGRGSGKSSILRFLRGVFSRVEDLSEDEELLEDYQKFFQKQDGAGLGVLTDNTCIEVYFVRDGMEYRITYKYAGGTKLIERLDVNTGTYTSVEDEAYIDFFQFEEYSQKQIFSIARQNNALRNRIDNAIESLSEVKVSLEQDTQEYKRLSETKRSLLQFVQIKGKINTEIADLKNKIELLKQSGISDIITHQQSFIIQKREVENYASYIREVIKFLRVSVPRFLDVEDFQSEIISEKYRDEISRLMMSYADAIKVVGEAMDKNNAALTSMSEAMENKIAETTLYKDAALCNEQFKQKRSELEEKGVTDMTDFEKYNQLLAQKEGELKLIIEKESEYIALLTQIEEQKCKVAEKRAAITTTRREFVSNNIESDKIKITIRPYFDQVDFVRKFRKIIQKSTGYETGINAVMSELFADYRVEVHLKEFKDRVRRIHDNMEEESPYDGWFTKMIRELSANQIDDIDMLYPEDQIEMRYRGRDNQFKPLTSASAGQKTTAILTFILSSGEEPLILDQPEDDLDNRLVYDLIVDKLRQIKETRQVIIVTHNANIPVNGDAEYVVSLSSDNRYLSISAEGTVENQKVKDEICEVMEGGIEAFETRAKKYNLH